MGAPPTLKPTLPESRVFQLQTPDWCWSVLAAHDEGRLYYASGQGQVHQPAKYAASDGRIVVQLRGAADERWLSAGGIVTLQLSGISPAARWVARVTARVTLVGDPDAGWVRSSRVLRDDAAAQPDWLRLVPVRVRGFSESVA